MSEKLPIDERYPGPLVVEGKLADAERLKRESNYLRGTIVEDLQGLCCKDRCADKLCCHFHQ